MKFNQVGAEDIPNIRQGRRGRVSYPIIKGFLETGYFLAELDLTGVQQSQTALRSSITAYISSHDMPIKVFSRQGKMYMMRLDIDENGKEIENWQANQDGDSATAEAVPVDPKEVAKRFAEEKGQTTK
jgi:hypothetical protein